jgi:hypothetical protein
MLKQDALYWGPPADDGDGGMEWPNPVEIKCRWENVEGAARDTMSNEVVNDSTVYVDRDVEVNGYLCFDMSLSAVTGIAPDQLDTGRRIKGFKKTPNLKATENLREVTV